MFTEDEGYFRLNTKENDRFLIGPAGEGFTELTDITLSVYSGKAALHTYLTREEANAVAQMLLTAIWGKSDA